MRQQGADWLAWLLQFIAGFLVGALFGLYITRRNWLFSTSMLSQHIVMLVTGAALIGAVGRRPPFVRTSLEPACHLA